ncbi:MAG: double-strand break repair helicase AddA [Paracoccaceae bacterium]
MKPDEATQKQINAADPHASTWLSANAGSGKTRVLTDRVARLLLEDVSPQNILCLTYTKAAASEMQNRLFLRLGDWSMKNDADLKFELEKLGVPKIDDPEKLAHARTLFARAIETPGGLRIQTIHSFCASLLRRFPLEAGVSPVFREMEGRTAKLLRQNIVEEMADGRSALTVREIARHYTGEDFDNLTAEIVRYRAELLEKTSAEAVWARFGLSPGFSEADLISEIFLPSDAEMLVDLVTALKAGTKITGYKAANNIARIDPRNPGAGGWQILFSTFLTGKTAKIPFGAKVNSFPTKDIREKHPDLIEHLNLFMERVERGRNLRNSLYSAQKSLALYNFAAEFLPIYENLKAQSGWLDFDDLITRARQLLTDPAVAQWVLFRLDGGLDHILVDEAQDTSPEQWQVVKLLAQEFSAGSGARSDVNRTIFVVGDKKQSIYSFQGADPKAFDQMRQHFSTNLEAVDQSLFERSLDHSFRSSFAVLNVVDNTFANTSGPSFEGAGHLAFHHTLPGRVDLWPVLLKAEEPEQKEWFDPTDKPASNDHRVMLAEAIAVQIQEMEKTGSIPDESGNFRRIDFGDFLILVQRRSVLFHEIIRACKSRGLPIAGADRLKIGAELAVKDLTALLSFLVTPTDDLSLAAALRSPLFDLSEAALFDLAHHRHEPHLWPALQRQKSEFKDIHDCLYSLRNEVDFRGPYELLERILTRHDGRRRLLARLGEEAEDGINAMLSQAIEYEHSQTPSLTGFLTWLQVDEVEIKRQPDSAGQRIRVMTTHGAKGLEAPIVILPDTGDTRFRQNNEIVRVANDRPIWRPQSEMQPEFVQSILADEKTAQEEERLRLLYVAMTRAEKWLIVCASGDVKDGGNSWYKKVEAGMLAAGASDCDFPIGSGLRYQHGDWISVDETRVSTLPDAKTNLPTWAITPSDPAPDHGIALTPSDLGGAKFLSGDTDESDKISGKQRGVYLHRLLEHLPTYSEEDWPARAEQLLGADQEILTPDDITDLFSEARAVLQNPDLSFIFKSNSLAEVDFTVQMGDLRINGTIDSLVISPDKILVVDFKSNRLTPDTPQETPDGILRQMGAYLFAVEQTYPDRTVEVAILWTRSARLMRLPHDIVRNALRDTTTS